MSDVDIFRARFAELTSVPVSDLNDDVALETLEQWDSMAMVGTAAIIFELTNVAVSPDEVEVLTSFKDIVQLFEAKAEVA